MRVRHWKDFAESLWSWCLDHWKALGLSGQVPITEKSSYLFTELRNGGFIPSLGLEKFFEIMEAALLRVLDGKIWPPHTKVARQEDRPQVLQGKSRSVRAAVDGDSELRGG